MWTSRIKKQIFIITLDKAVDTNNYRSGCKENCMLCMFEFSPDSAAVAWQQRTRILCAGGVLITHTRARQPELATPGWHENNYYALPLLASSSRFKKVFSELKWLKVSHLSGTGRCVI